MQTNSNEHPEVMNHLLYDMFVHVLYQTIIIKMTPIYTGDIQHMGSPALDTRHSDILR